MKRPARKQWAVAEVKGLEHEQRPARRQGTDAGEAGRFLDADEVQVGGGDPRTGRQTGLGEALDIPTARSCLAGLPRLRLMCCLQWAPGKACGSRWHKRVCELTSSWRAVCENCAGVSIIGFADVAHVTV